jgi:hypothetical protein
MSESESVRGEMPQELVERARDLIPAGESMATAELQRHVFREFVRYRELEQHGKISD